MTVKTGPKIVTTNLLVNLDAGNRLSYPGTGTSFQDLTNGGYNSTLQNGTSFTSDNLGGLVFDGVDDFTDIPYFGYDSITLDIWYKAQDTSYRYLLANSSYPSFNSIQVATNGNNVYFFLRNSTGSSLMTASTFRASTSLNTIYNVTATYNRGSKTSVLYLNGVSKYSVTHGYYYSQPYQPTQNWTIGKSVNLGGYFNDTIYNVKMYNRALSPSEILQNYNATKSRFGL